MANEWHPEAGLPSDMLDSDQIGVRRLKTDARISDSSDVVRVYASLSRPRVLTTGITQAEIATIEGDRFNSQRVYSNVDTATPLYVVFENPTDSGVIVGLQKRSLKAFSSGLTVFNVLWDYDISTATKTPIPIFNQNNAYRIAKPAKFEVSVLNTVTTPIIGDWSVTGAATILSEGIEREADFVPTSGQGKNESGDISPDLGYRIYVPGTGFLVKVVSVESNNRVILGYDWIEASISL